MIRVGLLLLAVTLRAGAALVAQGMVGIGAVVEA
jgi:hypothetical protein